MSGTHAEAAPSAPSHANLLVYAMDGALLGAFMVSACVSVALVEHPASPLRQQLASELARRTLIGLAMGVTALALIYSPWGKRSGALMNPALTLAFVRLGKLGTKDAFGYIAAQFAGGTLGVWASAATFGAAVGHPSVNYVVTAPGAAGELVAWVAEFLIAFSMVSVVMRVNRIPRLAAYAGWFAAALVALFITFEAPLSGMSLNPARSFASAVVAGVWHGFWIYLTAPVAGVLAAVELLHRADRGRDRLCGKLNHAAESASLPKCNCLDRSRNHPP